MNGKKTMLLAAIAGMFLTVGCQSDAPQIAPTKLAAASVEEPTKPAQPVADLAHLMGKFDPATDPDFVKIGKPYTDKPGMFLRKQAAEAFQKMADAARADGVTLKIISSTRPFEHQKNIWEGKWKKLAASHPNPTERALKILEFSSMPGTSRHHWGTDVDLNDLNNATFEAGGKGEKIYKWLTAHAHEFGFCQPYSPKNEARPHGYNEEKWHWSFMPISQKLLADYQKTVRNDMISGFAGAEQAVKIDAVGKYAGGISQACAGGSGQ
ncbi:MAG: M15 family metallopeptidase [Saprospiraceae bacterium]